MTGLPYAFSWSFSVRPMSSGLMQRSKGSLFDQLVGERKQIRGILRPSDVGDWAFVSVA